ncbi:YdaS family helix-turn-helix protein [Pseudomonas abietaniphila]|uniref:YdaS family helix-turn-helix protein n=1 Tax=Pseudomonas abietaniphila TaxID=89065 RepID=UPI0009E4A473
MTNIFSSLVDFFGGQVSTAKALGVTQGTVSGWTRGVHGCSADVALLAQLKTAGRFTAAQLRPSLADSLPTLDQTLTQSDEDDQSANTAVISSSAEGVSP